MLLHVLLPELLLHLLRLLVTLHVHLLFLLALLHLLLLELLHLLGALLRLLHVRLGLRAHRHDGRAQQRCAQIPRAGPDGGCHDGSPVYGYHPSYRIRAGNPARCP
ncbi:hypothetical protein GLUCOINTEAF2_0201812 [Komagataeibacter intermedius AF2]|uniref:Uncharacterized protein n=1 Tax=Komagataeibacter intermedius AF2 TaxID=1458464 RepID=A0A0N1FAQ6_9PROT|nr:hypothetical protein GLUCOINTEAF2_0201812 [Komagataeibacter intermedius AF2]